MSRFPPPESAGSRGTPSQQFVTNVYNTFNDHSCNVQNFSGCEQTSQNNGKTYWQLVKEERMRVKKHEESVRKQEKRRENVKKAKEKAERKRAIAENQETTQDDDSDIEYLETIYTGNQMVVGKTESPEKPAEQPLAKKSKETAQWKEADDSDFEILETPSTGNQLDVKETEPQVNHSEEHLPLETDRCDGSRRVDDYDEVHVSDDAVLVPVEATALQQQKDVIENTVEGKGSEARGQKIDGYEERRDDEILETSENFDKKANEAPMKDLRNMDKDISKAIDSGAAKDSDETQTTKSMENESKMEVQMRERQPVQNVNSLDTENAATLMETPLKDSEEKSEETQTMKSIEEELRKRRESREPVMSKQRREWEEYKREQLRNQQIEEESPQLPIQYVELDLDTPPQQHMDHPAEDVRDHADDIHNADRFMEDGQIEPPENARAWEENADERLEPMEQNREEERRVFIPFTLHPAGHGSHAFCRMLVQRSADIAAQPPPAPNTYPLRIFACILRTSSDVQAALIETCRQYRIMRSQWTLRLDTESIFTGRGRGGKRELIFSVEITSPSDALFANEGWKTIFRVSRLKEKRLLVWHWVSRSEQIRMVVLATFCEMNPLRGRLIADDHRVACGQTRFLLEAWRYKGLQRKVESVFADRWRLEKEMDMISETAS